MAQSTLIWAALALLLVSSTLGSSDVPFIVAHKKASLTRLKSGAERVSVSIHIYNQGSSYDSISSYCCCCFIFIFFVLDLYVLFLMCLVVDLIWVCCLHLHALFCFLVNSMIHNLRSDCLFGFCVGLTCLVNLPK